MKSVFKYSIFIVLGIIYILSVQTSLQALSGVEDGIIKGSLGCGNIFESIEQAKYFTLGAHILSGLLVFSLLLRKSRQEMSKENE